MSMGSQPASPSPQQNLQTAEQGAQQQQGLNVNAQAGSLPNYSNTLGGLQYNQTGTGPGGVPIYTATTSYSPAQQGLYSSYLGAQQEAGSQAANALGFGNYGTLSPSQQIGDMTSGRTGELMGTWLGSQIPFFNTQEAQLDTQLQNEGLQSGNPAYDNAQRQLQTNQGLAVAGAASQFEPAAFNQASQLYGLPMTVGQQLSQWGAPINPNTLEGPQVPGLQPGSISGILGPTTTGAMDQYQAQQAQYNAQMAAMGGLFGMGGNMLGSMMPSIGSGLSSAGASLLGMGPFMAFSDVRLKRDIIPMGKLDNGVPYYQFRFLSDDATNIGVLGHEAAEVVPEAVESDQDGYLLVNYARLCRGY